MANETYVEAYSEEDYLRDEQSFSNAEKENKVDWSAFSRLMTHDLLTNTNIIQDGCIGNVNIKDVHNEVKSLDFFGVLWVPLLNWVFLGMIFVTILSESKIIRKTLGKITSFIGNIRLK